MRVLLAPDSFGGTLSAADAARALAEGWREAVPGVEVDLCPLSDGGPGLVEVLATALPEAVQVPVVVEDALARPVPASVLLLDGTAYVESALACGLHLLTAGERDPRTTTTYGVGQLVIAALEAGARRVVVGLGGSATHDGGAGMLAALGVARHGADGRLAPGGAALLDLVRLEGRPDPRLSGVELLAATDVEVDLAGAALFAPQKGASESDIVLLMRALTRWADVLEPHLGVAVRDLQGAGAAGGLGAALLALGARRESGLDLVADVVRLTERVRAADLVVTGEGSFDATSLLGKAAGGVASRAQEAGVPCLVLAGQVHVGRREAAARGVDEAHGLVEAVGLEAAMAEPGRHLRDLAARTARQWSAG